MDKITKVALQKANLIEGEGTGKFMERVQNTHWVVQLVIGGLVLYGIFLRPTCTSPGNPIDCFTWLNKIFIFAAGLGALYLFGKLKTKSVSRKLSRIEGMHVLSYVFKDYLPKLGYVDSTVNYKVNMLRGVDWIEGKAPVYHYEVNVAWPLGKKRRYLVRMENQDTETSIAGNIIGCEEVDYLLTGAESQYKEYLLDMKFAKAAKLGVLKGAQQDEYNKYAGE